MAGRHYLAPERERALPPHPSDVGDSRRHGSASPLEDRIASNHREIQTLLQDNQRLAATHVALKQELSSSQLDIRHLSSLASEVKAEKDAQVRDLYERSLKIEAEVQSMDALGAELEQVRGDVQKLAASKLELAAKVKAVEADLVRATTELQRLSAVEAEIDTMRHHIERGRAAIEYEKKVHASNLEQSQAMEKNMISLTQEMEKLQAELANAEKRARAAAAAAAAANPNPGYAAGYANTSFVYGAKSYPDQYSMHQAQGSVDAGQQYGFVTPAPHGAYDIQQTHVLQQGLPDGTTPHLFSSNGFSY